MNCLEVNYEKCTGCMACIDSCPVSAISLETSKKGFIYPKIDNDICIKCGLCDKICKTILSNNKKINNTLIPIKIYAAKNKNESIRNRSSSGGVFYELTELILKNDGYVCGAIYNDRFEVEHVLTNDRKIRDKMQGSKYVQSNMYKLYEKIEEKLKQNKKVLFSGTPCEVAGVYKFLRCKNVCLDELYTCDIICHGVPSPKIFSDYLKDLENKYNSKIVDINFRYKENNYTQNIKIEFENGENYISNYFKGDYFYNLFLKDYILRDSCYRCDYANMNRISDITIGDFWGIEKSIDNFDDKRGVSLVFINTDKGNGIFSKISDKFNLIESKEEDCMQNNLKRPCRIPQNYNKMWKTYIEKGYLELIKMI